ncbi:MAG: DUF2799 domain-containing protein [Pseudomonadota bacterium]
MIKTLPGFPALLLLSALISGCQTMTPDECKYANWKDIGLRDGLAGQPISQLGDRVNDCTKAGAQVDTAQYQAGREQGLHSYCRLENAAPLGLSGKSYAGVCPARIDVEFRYRHQAGHAVYELRNKVSDLDSRSDRLQRRLRDTDKDEEKQLKGIDKDDERKRIRKDFDERRRNLRNELADIDRTTRRTRDDLRAAEYSLNNLR